MHKFKLSAVALLAKHHGRVYDISHPLSSTRSVLMKPEWVM